MLPSVSMGGGGADLHCKMETKNITTLVPGVCVNILKSYCMVRYLVECFGHCAFILEFYIDFAIILICLTGDCFMNKLKFRDPFKSYEIVPSIRLSFVVSNCEFVTFPLVSWVRCGT